MSSAVFEFDNDYEAPIVCPSCILTGNLYVAVTNSGEADIDRNYVYVMTMLNRLSVRMTSDRQGPGALTAGCYENS